MFFARVDRLRVVVHLLDSSVGGRWVKNMTGRWEFRRSVSGHTDRRRPIVVRARATIFAPVAAAAGRVWMYDTLLLLFSIYYYNNSYFVFGMQPTIHIFLYFYGRKSQYVMITLLWS